MSNLTDQIARAAALPGAIGESLGAFGGFVRCETCRAQWDVTSDLAGHYTAKGWPKCCGYSMRWWTQRQIDAGDVPA